MDIIKQVISDNNFLGAIFSTIAIILLGYYLRKTGKVTEQGPKALTAVLMNVALPALAFNAFMTNIGPETFTIGLNSFIFGFVAYVLLIVFSYIYVVKYKGDKLDAMRGLTIFGSTTFFGIPIISAFLGTEGTLYANLFNIAYRVFLYSYGFILFSGLKLEKKNLSQIILNPIILSTFLGFMIWMFQGSLPQVTIGSGDTAWTGAILRLDKTLPWFMSAVSYLGSLSSPLAWLAIGMTLAQISLADATKDIDVWVYSFVKLLVMPALMLVVMMVFKSMGFLALDYVAITGIVIMLATPPATVAVGYAINFDKEALFSSNASLISTVLSIVAIIFWLFVLTALHSAGIV
ncbi:malate permease (plasmid) [Erysipelothrix larvae]|uniref:Malate permease n=1 Tax=Erysipelothrix larvae TaxID=1514105 RepID=A0A0X8H260_9FIRM|nr:AEC family transporter [Erysipelothrix larvae]AMC93768.1 malate permease [Erysipelothrix larvae]AMC94688.1 malate permease [Erysipelothrix larvae]